MFQSAPAAPSTPPALEDIYFVSGLGADERVFTRLQLKGYRPVHIRWLLPERGEPIGQYAERLCEQIQSPRPVLVGLSFGGLIALEIAKHIPTKQLILISSVKTTQEIPLYFRVFRCLPLHRVFPFKTLLWAEYWLADWLFSVENLDERHLLRAILVDTEPRFLKWALHQVVTWRNQIVPENVFHIHGARDRIFPLFQVHPNAVLEGAGHFMVINRAKALSDLIQKILTETPGNQLSAPAAVKEGGRSEEKGDWVAEGDLPPLPSQPGN